ncbi:DinB family protein [Paenibacillus sp. FSL H7-0331]|uniref:DinB family protein n=1 Tax=Paenibacillus sp. FSL H7-0331 TaxID=1920421 RepID=UPI00096FBAED|nr:DinB family protein [Paenibacillus sp. FSL H7-0331]OME97859.1 squalene--hopene cyclase [Paenibacillus sp. FSL H7-0331]
MNTRPKSDEYLPKYEQYIRLVPDGNLVDILRNLHDQSLLLLKDLSEEQGVFQYAEGKWALKTVVGHITDVERLWNYRILRIARGDARELPGYDRDTFAKLASFDDLALAEVLVDFSAVRQSTLTLIGNLREEAFLRSGEFNGHPLSARAAAFIIAGHETHHMNVIKTKYLHK